MKNQFKLKIVTLKDLSRTMRIDMLDYNKTVHSRNEIEFLIRNIKNHDK